MYEYLEELDQMNWSARGNVLNQYLRNTSIGTTVIYVQRRWVYNSVRYVPYLILDVYSLKANAGAGM